MTKHWIVVGDVGETKIFASDELLETLELVDKLHNDHGRISHNHGSHPGGDSHEDGPGAQREGDERFARAVAQVIAQGDNQHKFERIILVAPPKFLGVLRNALPRAVAKKVVASIHHDWTAVPTHNLSELVRRNLPEAAGL